MTLAYIDTSALVKLFIAEPGSETVRSAWHEVGTIGGSRLVYAETRAALAAASRSPLRNLPTSDRGRVAAALDAVWQRMLKLDATETVVHAAGDVAQVHRLRGYDAVHLATALLAGADAFVCADAELLRAARACGMAVLDARR